MSVLFALIVASMMIKAQSITGDWKGTLSVQGVNLELIFHIAGDDGNLTGTLDVPLQGATGIPVDGVAFADNQLKLKVTAAQIVYNGTLQGDSVVGNYEQAGMSLPLTLKRFESKLPGNPALVTTGEELKELAALDKGEYKYSVADYFARPNASSFQLSPNGKYLSYKEKDGLKNHVYIKEIATGKV
ncbi:MAG TPA: S9 family peptidase, partial [Porphyromonadaceae bacterium]|nr:S9 family peptidase [Porphyromonadaceae bacterium]